MSTADFRIKGNIVSIATGTSVFAGSIQAVGFSGPLTGNVTGDASGNAGTATALQTARAISLTGDATATGNFDGTAALPLTVTLATSGVTAASYGSANQVPVFTTDAKGRITAAANVAITYPVTTVAGKTGAVTLVNTDVGLGNVTNVAQVAKSGDTMTGALSAPGLTSTAGLFLGSAVAFKDVTPAAQSTAATFAMDTFTASAFRSGKYVVQVTQGAKYEALELLIVHDGTNVSVVEYARVSLGAATNVTFDASISAGTLTVSYTQPALATTIKAVRQLTAV